MWQVGGVNAHPIKVWSKREVNRRWLSGLPYIRIGQGQVSGTIGTSLNCRELQQVSRDKGWGQDVALDILLFEDVYKKKCTLRKL